jgi:hypothetical protein
MTAIYSGQEVEAVFSASAEACDYGVPGTPVWSEIDPATVTLDSVTICGVEVKPAELPSELVNALHQLAVDDCEWTEEEV